VREVPNKEVLINLRLRYETREEFRVAAELRGATMSGLLHQFIVRTIREEKEREPDAFAELESIDLTVAEHSSEQAFDADRFPAQGALHKKFLKHQKSASETSNNPAITQSKDPIIRKLVNKSNKGIGKK
jgi:uncharacterized protein (DUF1778 family)